MRSALMCIFFALIITQRCRAVEVDDFRPTPIPLSNWRHDRRGGRAGTLHEIIKTDAPPTVAALPAHYWEDALRHSVYLTLVRDKIDQLITKGIVVSPDVSHEQHYSKEVSDHDLWEKIKSAPFDRLAEQELSSTGDVQIMAKGRLMEENGEFRFAEDEASTKKCEDEVCAEGVKAFWSVKRIRQKDDETSPGQYHYELTFSVTSPMPKKRIKPHENAIRTFTVRETKPLRDHWPHEVVGHSSRPQRAIWLHKNINVSPQQFNRHSHNRNLDRIFSSFFSDDDLFDDPPTRYKLTHTTYPTYIYQPHPKISFQIPQSDVIHQKRLLPYPYKPHTYKFSQPLPPPPLQHIQHPQHSFLDTESPFLYGHVSHQIDQGFMSSNTVKTTKPAFLPTPVTIPFTKNESIETGDKYMNMTEATFKDTDMRKEIDANIKVLPPLRPTAVKLNYFHEPVRPPVFNIPPGVFVTMDKKPFKPMPPVKLSHIPKLGKSKPIDFKPSPQVLEAQFPDTESFPEEEFRPIAIGYDENGTKSKDKNVTNKIILKNKPITKNNKKQVKYHLEEPTTYMPDIITASDETGYNTEQMEYTNIIGAITRTTPSQREKTNDTENVIFVTTTPISSTSTSSTTTVTTSSTTSAPSTTTITSKLRKRTRPPPKFKVAEKFKKHKRLTSTTAKASTTTERTSITKSDSGLTPQANSSSISSNNNFKTYSEKTQSTTPLTKETPSPTTIKPSTTMKTTTTTTEASTTTTKETTIATTLPKSRNRFRQSALMLKGTSVKHDRWSTTASERNRTVPLSKQFPPRRKGSNFQGYITTTPKKEYKQTHEDHSDHVITSTPTIVRSTTEVSTENNVVHISPATRPTYDETMDQYDFSSEVTSDFVHTNEDEKDSSQHETGESNEQETQDQSEFIFTSKPSTSESTIEIEETRNSSTTEAAVPSTTIATLKKKCKKKKTQNHNSTLEAHSQLHNYSEISLSTIVASATMTTTEKPVTPDIIDDLLGAFTFDEPSAGDKDAHTTPKLDLEPAESENMESYLHSDENFDDFLGSFQDKEDENDVNESEEYDDDSRELANEESKFYKEDDLRPARDTNDYTDYQDRPYSLLELMAME